MSSTTPSRVPGHDCTTLVGRIMLAIGNFVNPPKRHPDDRVVPEPQIGIVSSLTRLDARVFGDRVRA